MDLCLSSWRIAVRRFASAAVGIAVIAVGALATPLLAGDAEQSAAMGRKIMFERTIGFCVRFPYAWYPRDQYRLEVGDDRGGMKPKMTMVDGKPKMVLAPDGAAAGFPLRAVSATAVVAKKSSEVTALADSLIGDTFTWTEFDYYQRKEQRRFADPAWALAGITAYTGQNPKQCAMVLRWADRLAAIVMPGSLSDSENSALIDSFEVLSGSPKPSDSDFVSGSGKRMSWRENQCRQGFVFDRAGTTPVRIGANTPVAWEKGWEYETEHYRLIGNSGTSRLAEMGKYYEGLYRAYTKIFMPNSLPPYKTEVHVFNTAKDIETAASIWVQPGFSVRRGGGVIGGFFVPKFVSVWVYEESKDISKNPDFGVEHVSSHEGSHQFLHLTCNGSDHVPTWINEGLAVLFESGYFQGGEFLLMPPKKRIDQLTQRYQATKRTLVPLEQYIDHRGNIPGANYAEVYALTHLFIYGDRKALPLMQQFLRGLKDGKDGAKAFEEMILSEIIKANGNDRSKALAKLSEVLVDHVLSGRVSVLAPAR